MTAKAAASKEILEEAGESAAIAERLEVEPVERTATTAVELLSATAGAIKSLSLFPFFAILIVLPTLFGVVDDFISLVERLEFGLCLRVIGMQIGMELLCPFEICFTDILMRDVLVNT